MIVFLALSNAPAFADLPPKAGINKWIHPQADPPSKASVIWREGTILRGALLTATTVAVVSLEFDAQNEGDIHFELAQKLAEAESIPVAAEPAARALLELADLVDSVLGLNQSHATVRDRLHPDLEDIFGVSIIYPEANYGIHGWHPELKKRALTAIQFALDK